MTLIPHTLSRASTQLTLPVLIPAPRWRFTCPAQARNAYGAVAQEIVCAALGLSPIPINGKCSICFDAERGSNFYEIKSCRRVGGKVVIYDWRMEKEAAAGVPLRYAVLCHNVQGSDGHDLLGEMTSNGLELLVMHAATIHEVALANPLRQPHKLYSVKRAGFTRAGYAKGYRCVPLKALKALLLKTPRLLVQLYGLNFEVTLFTEP